jgi:branched-chain amino acid transport system ATP-binding protein
MSGAGLKAIGLWAGYGRQAIVRGIDLEITPGEIAVLLGPNGAGKTTTLMTLAGVLPQIKGEVALRGRVTTAPLHRRVQAGLGFVSDERCIFRSLTVRDNIRVGRGDAEVALDLFPELASRVATPAGLLSGGEQQMLAVARALSRRPKVLMVDELSLGLAPLVVDRLLQTIRRAADDGLGVLLVEQHVPKVLRYADRAYVLRRGLVAMEGTAEVIRTRLGEVEDAYLSVGR